MVVQVLSNCYEIIHNTVFYSEKNLLRFTYYIPDCNENDECNELVPKTFSAGISFSAQTIYLWSGERNVKVSFYEVEILALHIMFK